MSDDYTRISAIVAELRSAELVLALRHAVGGTSHWRIEAQNLLALIDAGVIPHPHEPPHHQHQDAA